MEAMEARLVDLERERQEYRNWKVNVENKVIALEADKTELAQWKTHAEDEVKTLKEELAKSKEKGDEGRSKAQKKRLEPQDYETGDNFEHWSWTLEQYAESCHPGMGKALLKWVTTENHDTITEETLKAKGINLSDPVMKDLWTVIYSKMKAIEGMNIVRQVSIDGQNAAELYRALKLHFDPESVITKQALRNQLHRVPRCKRLQDVMAELTKCEVKAARLEALEGRKYEDEDRIMILRDLVPKEIDEEIEKNPDVAQNYKKLKAYVTGICRRQTEKDNRKENSNKKKKSEDDMDVDAVTEKIDKMKEEFMNAIWGMGTPTEGGDINSMSKGWKGGGKGGWGKGQWGKGQWPGGGKAWGKGDGGKGDGGKGKGGGKNGGGKGADGKGFGASQRLPAEFHGTCNWCWEWGHSAKYCKKKDQYMDNLRKKQTASMEEKEDGEDDEAEEEDSDVEQFCLQEYQCGECNGETVAAMQEYMGYTKIESTIDSGSCESIMSNKDGGKIKIKPSPGSKAGKKYTSASGHAIDNEGQSKVRFMASNGGKRKMVYQRGDTSKTLASVGNITDMGNTVIMNAKGGHILKDIDGSIYKKAVKAAQTKTPFERKRGVYVMDMWIKSEDDDDSMDVDAVSKEWTQIGKKGKAVKPAGKAGFTRQVRA